MYGSSLGIFNVHVQRPWTTKYHPDCINPAELQRHINFSRWRLRRCNSTSDFVFGEFPQLGSSKSICWPNFGEISQLNPRLTYYYFWFLKTNGRHVGILLQVSIFTSASPSACHSASAYQILSKSDHLQHGYDVISIFKMAAISHIVFSQGNCRPLTECK